MKTIERMTNDELADSIERRVADGAPNWDFAPTLREAAARLRRPTPVDDDLLKMARDIDKLNAKLKVTEDAMTELRECLKQACEVACDGCRLAVWSNQKFVKCKKHSNWKCPFGTERWRKALERAK